MGQARCFPVKAAEQIGSLDLKAAQWYPWHERETVGTEVRIPPRNLSADLWGAGVSDEESELEFRVHLLFVQATVDGGSETGELYAAHVALRHHCMPDISIDAAPPFVALSSLDNIPIESSWHLFINYVGMDIKQTLLLGKELNYFNPRFQLHVDLFNWLWPKIVQLSLDDFVDYWNNHKIRSQRGKLLPSGFSPNYVCDFPEQFGLTKFGEPAPQHVVDALRQKIPKSL
ncbi:hypothetical protein B0H13DRAFT_2309732 [Mycena leptocephala]|nr:hypothetical protein B0H13DRAFT_2309732 [Mycena leptocephala]